jgi:hypothetical protein
MLRCLELFDLTKYSDYFHLAFYFLQVIWSICYCCYLSVSYVFTDNTGKHVHVYKPFVQGDMYTRLLYRDILNSSQLDRVICTQALFMETFNIHESRTLFKWLMHESANTLLPQLDETMALHRVCE